MGNAVLPALPGLAWDITTSPEFNTKVHRARSGYEVRAAFMVYPLWKYGFKYELLRDDATHNELKTLLGFFNARNGMFDSFLYSNPSDNAVSLQAFGVGDGTTRAFQLVRSYSGYIEPVQNLNGSPLIWVNGTLQSIGVNYTLSSTGLVTFLGTIAAGQIVTWSGSFYYRCRFMADSIDFNQFMKDLYDLKKLDFIGSPMNKV